MTTTRNLPPIPDNIDIEACFIEMNTWLSDDYKYGTLTAFKREFRRMHHEATKENRKFVYLADHATHKHIKNAKYLFIYK